MKPILIGAFALCLALNVTACSKKNGGSQAAAEQPKPATQPVQPTHTIPVADAQPALKYTKKCAAEVADQDCAGRFGFTVNQDGSYIVGPGPSGQTLKGNLDADELQSISKAFSTADLFTLNSFDAPTCQKDIWENIGYDMSISLAAKNQTKELARTENAKDICFAPSVFKDLDAATAFEDAVYKLVDKYAANFPNAAAEAANQLEQLYAGLQTCAADNECAYINENFDVAQADEYVGCSAVKPLMVGNAKQVAESKAQLIKLRDQAVAAGAVTQCVDNGFTVFADKPAVCDTAAKKCKINPNL